MSSRWKTASTGAFNTTLDLCAYHPTSPFILSEYFSKSSKRYTNEFKVTHCKHRCSLVGQYVDRPLTSTIRFCKHLRRTPTHTLMSSNDTSWIQPGGCYTTASPVTDPVTRYTSIFKERLLSFLTETSTVQVSRASTEVIRIR
jgi:hypothetical protein